ncbi:MAG: hypothetical protein HFF18_00095 [Oscillospiraceae bacterium]|nr:hypothetical protein [Oscillospiraceae bacterium]
MDEKKGPLCWAWPFPRLRTTDPGSGATTLIAVPTASVVLVNGVNTAFDACNIGGNNYFKLRDLGSAFSFGVDWDGAANTVLIDPGKGYTPD